MLYSHYYMLILSTGEVTRHEFKRSHHKEYLKQHPIDTFSDYGQPLPEIEALSLINKWNRAGGQPGRHFVYWVEP